MYIVYIHSEYNKIMVLYSKAVEEKKKLEDGLLEFNSKIDKLYKEITDLKVEKAKLVDENKILQMMFQSENGWCWYLVEIDEESKDGVGFVRGFEDEWGYFNLKNLSEIPSITRNEDFKKIKFKELEC